MRLLTLRPCLALLLTTAGVLAAAPAASADTVNCTFDGVAVTLDPDIPGIPATGGGGDYSFSGGAQCRYHDNTPPIPAVPVYLTNATISSTGEYQNDICLTGWWFSNWGIGPIDDADRVGTTVVSFANPAATDVVGLRYMVRWTQGVGVLEGQEANGDPTSRVSGALYAEPSPGSSCSPGTGVSGYELNGLLVLTTDA
jgi:hypothetical protein